YIVNKKSKQKTKTAHHLESKSWSLATSSNSFVV
ncbi:MAG: hypothetical protein ACI90V_007478, partial [Bacillariaceae sp.]